MPTPTHDQVRQIGDVALLHKWNVIFHKLPAGLNLTSEEINVRAVSTTLPKKTADVATATVRGHEVHYAGIVKYSSQIDLMLIEDVSSNIEKFVKSWYELIWQPKTGIQRKKSEYEAGMILHLLDNFQNVRSEYRLTGVWLFDYDTGGTYDGSSSEIVKMTLNLKYDYFLN